MGNPSEKDKSHKENKESMKNTWENKLKKI